MPPAPEVPEGAEWYVGAWRELSTCRARGIDGAGPIPWRDVVEYGDRLGLEPDVAAGFLYIVRSMEVAFFEYREDWRERQPDAPPSPTPRSPNTGRKMGSGRMKKRKK